MYELSPIGAAEVDGCGKSAPPRHGGDEAQLQATEVVHGQLEELHARVVVFQVLRVRCASKRAQNTATRQQCYAAATQFARIWSALLSYMTLHYITLHYMICIAPKN